MSEEPRKHRNPTPMMRINHLSKLFRDKLRRESEEAGIPGGYRSILSELAHSDHTTQFELAKRTHLTPPTVSVTLQKMEHDGHITRTPDAYDLRQMQVALTDKGREAEHGNHMRANALEQIILDGFSDEERQTLDALLCRMEDNLHKAVDFSPCHAKPPRKDTQHEKMV